MVQINFAQKQVNAKVVYYGPGMSGKTTNLEVVHQRAPESNKGELTSISTDGDRTLFFDFMPLDLGTVAGMRTCFQIYTVPGQVYYNSTRKLVLQGCDGVVFVADSSASMVEENLESLRNLEENLNEYGKSLATMPHVLQYNKRDLPDALPVEELNQMLNPHGAPFFEAIASTGQGVFPTLKALAARVLESIHTGASASAVPSARQQTAQAGRPQPQAAPQLRQQPQPQAPMPAPRVQEPVHAQSAQQAAPLRMAGAPPEAVHGRSGSQGGTPIARSAPQARGAAPAAPQAPAQNPQAQAGGLTLRQSPRGAPSTNAPGGPHKGSPTGSTGFHATASTSGAVPARTNDGLQLASRAAPAPRPASPAPAKASPAPAKAGPTPARSSSSGAAAARPTPRALEGTRFRPRGAAPVRAVEKTTQPAGRSKLQVGLFLGLAMVVGGVLTKLVLTLF